MTFEEDAADEKNNNNNQDYNTDDDVGEVTLLLHRKLLHSPTFYLHLK